MNTERLLKLADHLEHGKLGHEVFNFNQFNSGHINERGCGTKGCAIGECPIVFPDHWRFTQFGHVELINPSMNYKDDEWDMEYKYASEFFQISPAATIHLFSPYGQKPNMYGGVGLGRYATPNAVASNIRVFIKRNELK